VGHEATHRLIELLGRDDPLVQEGLAIARGVDPATRRMPGQSDEEELSDLIGDYYAARTLEPNKLRRIANWLQELWLKVKQRFGLTMTNEQVLIALNARMTQPIAPGISVDKFTHREYLHQLWYVPKRKRTTFKNRKSGTYAYQRKADPVTVEIPKVTKENIQNLLNANIGLFEDQVAEEGRMTNTELMDKALVVLLDPKKLKRAEREFASGEGRASLEGLLALHVKADFSSRHYYVLLSEARQRDPSNLPLREAIEQKLVAERTLNKRLKTWRGRALQLGNNAYDVNAVIDAVSVLERNLSPEEAKRLAEILNVGSLQDEVVMMEFINAIKKPQVRDYAWEIALNGWLSSPGTHIVNAASNTVWLGFQMPHRAMQSAVDATLQSRVLQAIWPSIRGKEREVFLGETLALWTGAKAGRKKAKQEKVFSRTIKGESVSDLASKFSVDLGTARKAFARANPNTELGKAMRKLAPVISAPSDALVASDVYFRTIAYDMQLNALAFREAKKTGQPAIRYISSPTRQMLRECEDFAAMATFNDKPGRLVNAIIHWREKIPFGAGRLVIPFVNTVNNIFQRGVEMTPALGLAVHRKQALAGNTDILAKQLEGAIMAVLLMTMFDRDDITAGVPESPTKRAAFYAQGKIPFAIKIPAAMPVIGGSWLSYARIEPFNTVLSTIASAWKALDEYEKEPEPDETQIGNFFTTLADNIAGNLVESTFTENLGRLIKPSFGEGLKRTAEKVPASFVPYSGFWRTMNRAYEAWSPDEEGEQGVKYRERNSWMGELAQVVPLYAFGELDDSFRGKQRVDAFGEKIVIPGGVWRQMLPIRYSTPDLDVAEEEMVRLDIMPGLPRRDFKIRGEDVQMPADMFHRYAIAYGAATKEAITRLVSSSFYQRLSEERKLLRIQRTVRRTHARLRARGVRELQASLRESARTQPARQGSGLF
jgi:hypothetical protein